MNLNQIHLIMNGTTLKDKVAIVTGSSMGIGKVIAKDFASQGAKVVLNGQEHGRKTYKPDRTDPSGKIFLLRPALVPLSTNIHSLA